jgi:hypothetical integral membrane protein (TIGR02206 family)
MQNASFSLIYLSFSSPVFHAFNAQHIITLIVIACLCVLVALSAKAMKTPHRIWLGRFLGFVLLGYTVSFYAREGIIGALNWQYSLPLELCNLVLIACIVSLFRPSRFAFEIAYFWGLGGVLLAAVTPDITQGFPSWQFILFFWGHGATLFAVVYFIAGQGFRPRKGSVLRVLAALNIYGLVVGSLNAATGWNYGYLCQKPVAFSLFDYFGPWPWYLLSIEIIAVLVFLLLDLPWRLLASRRAQHKALLIDD